MENTLYTDSGHRLYINTEEREALIKTVHQANREVRGFASTLIYTGCRLTEALQLTPRRVDLSEHTITVRSLKKKKGRIVYRTIPVPAEITDMLNMIYGIREIQRRGINKELDAPLWPWGRTKGWSVIKKLMNEAGIPDGVHKTAKGLRHSYGVNAIKHGIQLNMLQKWMGHASADVTAIYANAQGDEEREIAARMWG